MILIHHSDYIACSGYFRLSVYMFGYSPRRLHFHVFWEAECNTATVEVTLIRVVPDEVASTKVTTTVTSAPPGNDHNFSFKSCFLYNVPDLDDFAEMPATAAPSEGVVYLYNRVIQS